MGREGNGTYVSPQNQIINHAHNSPHRAFDTALPAIRACELDCLTITQKAAGEELIVYIEGCCA